MTKYKLVPVEPTCNCSQGQCCKVCDPDVATQPATPEKEPVAWLVYLPSEHAQRVYDDQDDPGMVDDLTNIEDAEVTPLYTHPAECKRCEECAEYLKEDETPLQRMQRDQKDAIVLLNLLAKEKDKLAAIEARNAELEVVIQQNDGAISERTELLQRAEKVIADSRVLFEQISFATKPEPQDGSEHENAYVLAEQGLKITEDK